MEKQRKQYRLNLAFRADDTEHIAVYKRLSAMTKSTDYIVSLMLRDSRIAQQPPAAVDTQALCDLLLPLIESTVNKAVKEAVAALDLQNEESAVPKGTISSDLELGLKGLGMFY